MEYFEIMCDLDLREQIQELIDSSKDPDKVDTLKIPLMYRGYKSPDGYYEPVP